MIRVNLIGSARKGGKRKGGKAGRASISLPDIPNVGILLFILLLVMESAGLYLWQTNAAMAADKLQGKLNFKRSELAALQETHKSIVAIKAETDKLGAQKKLFDELFADKVGPVNALSYLSFILEPRDEASLPGEDLRAMEAAGWRVQWNAKKAWFTSFREAVGEVTLIGEAMDHEDVAEVQRRLESSPYFRDMKLVFQERKRDDRLNANYIEFQVKGSLLYMIVPFGPPAPPPEGQVGVDADALGAAGGSDAVAAARSDADAGSNAADPHKIDVVPSAAKLPAPSAADADAAATADAEDVTAEPDVIAREVAPAPAPIVPKPAPPAAALPRREEAVPAAEPPPAAEARDGPEAAPAPSAPAAGEKE